MNDRLVKVLKVHTCLSCGLPSESVSESYWTALQRESHGHIWGRPSEMQKVGRQQKRKERKKRVEDMERVDGQKRGSRERDK